MFEDAKFREGRMVLIVVELIEYVLSLRKLEETQIKVDIEVTFFCFSEPCLYHIRFLNASLKACSWLLLCAILTEDII